MRARVRAVDQVKSTILDMVFLCCRLWQCEGTVIFQDDITRAREETRYLVIISTCRSITSHFDQTRKSR